MSAFFFRSVILRRAIALSLGLTAALGAAANADTLSLGTGISANWDRLAQPGASPVIQLAVANDNNDLSPILYAITLGLSFQPVGGATGSLEVASVANAATNPVFTSGIQAPTINPFPFDGYTSIAVFSSGPENLPVPQAGAGLIGLTLSSTNAQGTFDIVVQSFGEGLSSWNNFDFDEFPFANANSSPLTIGQISVTTVPEPSSIALVAAAGGALLAARARRRLRRGR